MKCMCCHYEFRDNADYCPVCQFQVPYGVGGTGDEAVRKNAQRYREELLRNTRISVVGYNWKRDQDEMKSNGKRAYPLTSGSELDFGKPVWMEQKFARNASRKEVELTCRIQKDGREQESTVTLPAPETEDLWQVGVELEPGMKLRFLLRGGDRQTRAEEAVSLL